MVVVNTNTEKFLVVQSNELIEATYSPMLTARAHKVSRLVFSLISPSDTDLKLYTVSIETLKRFLGYKEEGVYGRFQQDLRDIAELLNKEPIVIKSENKVTSAYLIAAYQIDWKLGTVTFEIPQLLKPFLIELKRNFTKYPLVYIPKLRSSYAIRLYELLYQYKNIGHRAFELDDLQQKVGSAYTLYGDFKRKVLGIAQRDLTENADITFDYKELKAGKKVTGIRFAILPNERNTRHISAPAEEQRVLPLLASEMAGMNPENTAIPDDLKKHYTEAGIGEGLLENSWRLGFALIDDEQKRTRAMARCKTPEAYFREKLSLLQHSKTAGQTNPAGFLLKALHEDWQNPAVVKKEGERRQAPKNAAAEKRLREIERQRDDLKARKDAFKNSLYEQLITDASLLAQAHQAAKNGVGEETRAAYFPAHLPPLETFQQGGLAKNLIALQIEKIRPELFEQVNKTYQRSLAELDAEEQVLRGKGR